MIIAAEIVILNFSYQKRNFTTSTTEQIFSGYMEEFSGKLTEDKKAAILAEQERIVDALNVQSNIEKKLLNGEYDSESEFLSEYERVREITDRKEALDLVMEKYYYAEKFPDCRYLTVGDYSALGQDFPDIPLLAAVIFLTALLFLNEETSNVITYIRIGENGRRKTLFGKIAALLVFVLSCQAARMAAELITLTSQGSFAELSYPIQSIEFFQNCSYNISILQGFLIISLLRTVGYFFIAALVILLSVTLRKVLFTVFIPSAFCVLQQFAFTPATPAYYLPTGFLRAVGYLRGDVISENDSGEKIKLFAEIPLAHSMILIVLTLIFISVSVKIASSYYSCKSAKKIHLKATFSLILSCVILSGCSAEKSERIIYNLAESAYFAQDENSYYISDTENIMCYSKENGEEFELIHSAFDNSDAVNSLFKHVLRFRLAVCNMIFVILGFRIVIFSRFYLASFANADLNTYCLVLILANIILLPKALLLYKENNLSLKNEIIAKSAYIQFLENALKYKIYRENGFLMESASERYLHFREMFPKICQSVKQQYIATYLGIVPESLSRIKRNLVEE